MKKFLWAMTILFAILTIVFYSNSTVSTGYGEVANMQMTVFAAACAVLCGVNLVGALVLTAIESQSSSPSISYEEIAHEVLKSIEQSNDKKRDERRRERTERQERQQREKEISELKAQASNSEIDLFLYEI